jgi:hypothetical protein
MHRLLIGLILLILMMPALAAPDLVSAQDAATPTPAPTPEAGATVIRIVQPFIHLMNPGAVLNPALTETAADEAVCSVSSVVAPDRPDAWTCFGATNQIYDPCFENPFLPPDQQTELACFETPFTSDVVLVTLTEPLVREKEAPDPVMAEPTSEAGVIEPWELPWALELANGDRCSLLRGTLMAMAGQVVHYGCVDQGMVLGEVNTDRQVWTVNYLAAGDFASEVVAVVVAWS